MHTSSPTPALRFLDSSSIASRTANGKTWQGLLNSPLAENGLPAANSVRTTVIRDSRPGNLEVQVATRGADDPFHKNREVHIFLEKGSSQT